MACEQGFLDIIQYMHSKDPAICRITLVDKTGETPIHLAAQGNHVNVVEFLLEQVRTLIWASIPATTSDTMYR